MVERKEAEDVPGMYEASFELSQIDSINVLTLLLPEIMDSNEFDRLNLELLDAIASRPQARWVLDLANLGYMGSSALGLMVNLRQRIKDLGGKLILCNINPPLMRIMRTCCLERLFAISKTRQDAVRTYQSGR